MSNTSWVFFGWLWWFHADHENIKVIMDMVTMIMEMVTVIMEMVMVITKIIKVIMKIVTMIMMTSLCKGRGQLWKVQQRNLVTWVRVAHHNCQSSLSSSSPSWLWSSKTCQSSYTLYINSKGNPWQNYKSWTRIWVVSCPKHSGTLPLPTGQKTI